MKHYFQTNNPDLEAIQQRLVLWFKQHEFYVDYANDDKFYLIQAKKTGKLRALAGMNVAFKVKIYFSEQSNEFVFESEIGQWTQNIAGAGIGAIFTGGLTLVTGAAAIAWTKKIERDVIEFMEESLQFRKTKSVETAKNPKSNNLKIITQDPKTKAENKIKEQVEKLEVARDSGVLSEYEYEQKKSLINSKLCEYECDFIIEDKSKNLHQALENGVLSKEEYDNKISDLKISVKEDIEKERRLRDYNGKVAKYKSAFNAKILTEEEYNIKISDLEMDV